MDQEQLIELLKAHEWRDVEFKEAQRAVPKNAYETVSAFANTEGGHLVFGVKKEGGEVEIVGVLDVDKVQGEFLSTLRQPDKISMILDVEESLHKHDDTHLLIFYVPEAQRTEKPVYLNGDIRRTFIRRGGCDVRCSEDERNRFLIDAAAERYDSQSIDLSLDTCFNGNSIKWYRNNYEGRAGNRSCAELSDRDFLAQMGLLVEQAEQLKPSRAAILLFGTDAALRQLVPKPVVDCQIFSLTRDKAETGERWSDRLIVEENLVTAWQALVSWYEKLTERPFRIDPNSLQRDDTPPDYRAFRETIVNLLIHQDYNLPFDVDAFAQAGRQLLDEVERELSWMYETLHTDGRTKGRIEYTVWSEVFACPDCAGEVVFLEAALDKKTKRVRDAFPCPHCGANLTKDNLERVFETRFDPAMNSTWKRITFRPSLMLYVANGQRYEKQPNEQDLKLLERIAQLDLPPEIPTSRFPIEQMYHGSRIEPKGFTHVHHFFLPRAAHALAALWRKAKAYPEVRIRHMLLFFVEQAIWGLSVLNRYGPLHFSQVNRYLTGVYYVASQHAESSPWYILEGKLARLEKAFNSAYSADNTSIVTTDTLAQIGLPDDAIDYIFTDPPFGENIYYADLNLLIESWHGVLTNSAPEAIVDQAKKKTLADYQRLMQQCFEKYYRVLKPGRWMTVVFHNSRNAVWNAIQEAMLAAGFVVADVRTMDKQQGSYRQVTSTAVKQDLVISAYKPNGGLEKRFHLEAGTEEGVWDFIRTHLNQLPVFVTKNGQAETIAERQNYFLFDRMVAFHVQRGETVPLSAAEFYQGLAQRFPERDGMYFLPEQAAEYDKKRMTVKDVLQLEFFVTDEASAIQWLKQQLTKKPQTFQEIHPQFLREIGGWQKHEKLPELSELLKDSFLPYNGEGEVPSQIHSYLSTNFKELRNLSKDDPTLRAKAKDRWYVPDPNKASDLEKLRERALLREFWEYLPPGHKPAQPESQEGFIPGLEPKATPIPKGKKFRVIRMEAVRAGFKHCWQNRDYRTIIAVAQRIPENILQEDQKLLMWYDQALTRTDQDS